MKPTSAFFLGSFDPPDAARSRRPASILLDLNAYIADRRNATTAAATSTRGCTVEVSFWIAAPPAVSYSCVHCPCSKSKDVRGLPVGAQSGRRGGLLRPPPLPLQLQRRRRRIFHVQGRPGVAVARAGPASPHFPPAPNPPMQRVRRRAPRRRRLPLPHRGSR
ncbi:hypothetical protein ACP70R_047705 [Stipagrostis hirtigluma subsp. patula]